MAPGFSSWARAEFGVRRNPGSAAGWFDRCVASRKRRLSAFIPVSRETVENVQTVAADLGLAGAAVLGEERDQATRPLDVEGVEDVALHSPRTQQPGMFELGEMMGKRRRRHADPVRDFSGGKAVRALLHEKAEYGQAVSLGQRRKRGDGLYSFHNSTIVEISK